MLRVENAGFNRSLESTRIAKAKPRVVLLEVGTYRPHDRHDATQIGAMRPLLIAGLAALAAARPFILGSDLSYLPMLDAGGTDSPFRATNGGPTGDALAMTAAGGATHVRLSLWVNPLAHNPTGWPARGDDTYANLTGVLAMAKRVVANKMRVWLDFHYSDTWADPGHQAKPAAWAALTVPELAAAVTAHTTKALVALAAQGTPADVVQVGNEISAGMLWAEPRQTCAEGGALFKDGCAALGPNGNWPTFASLMAAGLRAVRAAQPDALLMVHSDLGNELNASSGAYIVTFYEKLQQFGAGDFDAIGLSFYAEWGAGPSTDVAKLSIVHAAFPDKLIILAETAYPFQGARNPWAEFPFTEQGQLAYLKSVTAQVRALQGGGGLAYWGAEFYNQSSGAGWTSLWGEDGVALPALSQGFL